MQVMNEEKNTEKVVFAIKLPQEEWEHALSKAKNNAIKNVKLDGYRPGKVPPEIAKKWLNMGDVYTKAVNSLLPSLVETFETKDEAFKKYDDEVINESRLIEITKVDDQNAEIKITYDLFPAVTLDDYHHNDLQKYEPREVTDAEVDQELARVARSRKIVEAKTEGTLEKGDIAVFDFTGYKNGEVFSGGSAKNYELEIGSEQFIPGFEAQMVGMKLGEERDLNLTFPADYAAKDLAGQAVVFHVRLNEMKHVIMPKVDDHLIQELDLPDVKTVPEYIAYFKKQVLANEEQNFMSEQTAKIINFIIGITHVSHLPNILVQEEQKALYDSYNNQLKQQGLSIEQYLNLVKESKEDFEKKLSEEARRSALLSLGMEQIAKAENIEITEQDIMDYVEKVVKIYGGDAKEIREKIGDQTDRIESAILQQRVFDAVVSYGESQPKQPQESAVVTTDVQDADAHTEGTTTEAKPATRKRSTKKVARAHVEAEPVATPAESMAEPTAVETQTPVAKTTHPRTPKASVHEPEAAQTDDQNVVVKTKPSRRGAKPTVTKKVDGEDGEETHATRHQRFIQMEIPDTIKYDGEATDFHVDPEKELAEMREADLKELTKTQSATGKAKKTSATKHPNPKTTSVLAENEPLEHQSKTKTRSKKGSSTPNVEPKVQQKVTPISQYVDIVENVDDHTAGDGHKDDENED